MSASELNEHRGYWNDDIKRARYTAALNEVVTAGDTVIDLGSGTGLLGILAARSGAGHVWAYDNGDIIGAARELAEANGCTSQMTFIREYTVDATLPQADVIICDQIGGLVFDAGVLEFFADAKARALKPGGTLVPAAFDLFLAPVDTPDEYRNVSDWGGIEGFDLAPTRQLAANTEHYVGAENLTLCAPENSSQASSLRMIR